MPEATPAFDLTPGEAADCQIYDTLIDLPESHRLRSLPTRPTIPMQVEVLAVSDCGRAVRFWRDDRLDAALFEIVSDFHRG